MNTESLCTVSRREHTKAADLWPSNEQSHMLQRARPVSEEGSPMVDYFDATRFYSTPCFHSSM